MRAGNGQARHFDVEHAMHAGYIGPKRPTKTTPGINAQPMHLTGQKTVKDCRLTDKRAPLIRSKSLVSVTSGAGLSGTVRAKDCKQWGPMPKAKAPKTGNGVNARKRARRAA